ncbi:MAG: Abi family protein [Chitinophagales bacterium]
MDNSGAPLERPLKSPTTFDEQVALLRGRGLLIDDEYDAREFLSRVNYYRFTAYLLPFKCDNGLYKPGTSFETVRRICDFDRRLRSLILAALEPVEVKLRTQMAYYHAHEYGAAGYEDPRTFVNPRYHDTLMQEIREEVRKQQDKSLFVNHHLKHYGGHFPIWVACELFTFGALSRFYANMRPADRKAVAGAIQCDDYYLVSWLRGLTELRNICAHYARLYFHQLKIRPRFPKGDYEGPSGYVFDYLYILGRLYRGQKQMWQNEFVSPLEALVGEYQDAIRLEHIGFPDDWCRLLRACAEPIRPRAAHKQVLT